MKYDWVHKIEYMKIISGEFRDMVDIIGIDLVLKLYEHFGKQQVYFSEKPIMELKRHYIKQHPHDDPKQLARELCLSLREIYYILNEKQPIQQQEMLFNEKHT